MAAAKVTDEQKIEMQALRDGGMSLNKIGEKFGIAGKTVHYHTVTPEGMSRKAHHPPALTDESAEMWRLYAEGKTYEQIAEIYGIGYQAVGQRIRKYRELIPDTTREVVMAREMAQLDEVRGHLLEIARNEKGFTTTADRINASRAVFSSMERLAKMMGLDASDLLDERRVRIAERQADLIEQAFRAFITILGMDPDAPRVLDAMSKALSVVATEDAT